LRMRSVADLLQYHLMQSDQRHGAASGREWPSLSPPASSECRHRGLPQRAKLSRSQKARWKERKRQQRRKALNVPPDNVIGVVKIGPSVAGSGGSGRSHHNELFLVAIHAPCVISVAWDRIGASS